MQFFTQYFKLENETPSMQGEYTVLCPFTHYDRQGIPYKEENASAHINEAKSIFHCKACGEGISEPAFISRMEGISYKESLVFLRTMEGSSKENWNNKVEALKNNEQELKYWMDLGLSNETIDNLQLGFSGQGIDFPVFVYGELLDVRNYNPEGQPRIKSRTGAKNLIVPFDMWRDDKRPTVLAAGEKDMSILREKGFNAITFTGGEMSFPQLFKHSFKGRKVYIAYDNDQTGYDGAARAAYFLKEAGAIPKMIVGHHLVCTEKGGDIHDYFHKYGKSAEDFQELMDTVQELEHKTLEKVKDVVFPLVRIEESSQGKYINKRFVRSQATVVSIFETMYSVPEYVRFVKYDETDNCMMAKGEIVEWILDDENIEDVLYLIDSVGTKAKRDNALRILAGIDTKEMFVKMQIMSDTNVWKSVITDTLEAIDGDGKASELLIYSIGTRLSAGKKYEVIYKPASHPLEGMQVVGVSKEVIDIEADVLGFKIPDELKKKLEVFQVKENETVADKMQEFYERSKGFIGVEARKDVMQASDLFFHTPLEFSFGKRIERSYLDIMIIGDSRTMKSATAKAMHEMYELGTFTSLKSATSAGLIGGSDRVSGGGFQTKLGLIPRSHKGAIIMEEASTNREIISRLTEIRSSNRVRIDRVNGSTDVPAMVRMLTISNTVPKSGVSIPLRSYSNGVQIILELIGASEDIARYDYFLLVGADDKYVSPLDMFELEAFDKELYKARIRWIWSRTAEQVPLSREILQHIVKHAESLNKKYDCHIKLFGPEAWKKIARIAISVAGMVMSTDENYETIVVKEEHVDFSVKFMEELYDNSIFKLQEYVTEERSYSACRDVDIAALQDIYTNNATMLEQMLISTELTQRQLQLVSGLESKDFGGVINALGSSKFIRWHSERIVPTNKFREAMTKIDKKMYLERASERNDEPVQ